MPSDMLTSDGVSYPAELVVHTPSGPVPACEKHAQAIKAVMAICGAHVCIVPAPLGLDCTNCVNEAKANG